MSRPPFSVAAWTVAILGAALFCGVFLALRPAPPPRALPPPEPARLRFLPIAQGSPAAEARALWSHALFTQPSEAGFGRAHEPLTLVRPPLDPPEPPAHVLPAPPPEPPPPDTPPTRPVPAATAPPVRLGPSAPVLPAVRPRRRLEFSAAWAEADFAHTAWPGRAEGERTWDITAQLDFDGEGVPERLFLDRTPGEPEPDPEARREIARTLRAWRLAPGAPRSGRVRLRFEPPAAAPGED